MPGRTRLFAFVPLLLAAAAGSLFAGLTLPIMQVSSWIFFSEPFSILSGLELLVEEEDYLLAAIIGTFSVLFPSLKILVLLVIWGQLFASRGAPGWLAALETLGKWSMLDVFVVALLIFAAKVSLFADADPEPAVGWFTASVILTGLAGRTVRRSAVALASRDLPAFTGAVDGRRL